MKAFGIVPTRDEFEDQKKRRGRSSPQRHVLPTYSEYIKSLPTPKRLAIGSTDNPAQDAPHSPTATALLSPKTKESKKDLYRNMHHESSPAPSEHGMDDDDTFDSDGGYDDHGVHHLSAHANALLSRISTADESDDVSPRNLSTPLISPRKSHSQRSLGQAAQLLSISNEVSAIQINKSMNNTIEVQDFLSVESMSEGGEPDNSKTGLHISSPDQELPLDSGVNASAFSPEERDNEIKPRIISKKQATVIGVNRVSDTETTGVNSHMSLSSKQPMSETSTQWVVATKADKVDSQSSHAHQDSHESMSRQPKHDVEESESYAEKSDLSPNIFQDISKKASQPINDQSGYVFPDDSDADDSIPSIPEQNIARHDRSQSIQIENLDDSVENRSNLQDHRNSSQVIINEPKSMQSAISNSSAQVSVPPLRISKPSISQAILSEEDEIYLQQISETQKAAIIQNLRPPSPVIADHQHFRISNMGRDSSSLPERRVQNSTPDYQMEHMIQRIRILEAESRARREQHLMDEEKYKLSETAWSGEIISLKVYIKDIEEKLQEERARNRKLLSEVASRDAEIASLTCNLPYECD